MKSRFVITSVVAAGILLSLYALTTTTNAQKKTADDTIVGAWKGHVQFKNGAYSSVKDLDFLYVFNAGGTMTESSNYDGYPPVPPAYGIWRKLGPKQYEAKYEFYTTNPPAKFDEIAKGGGWLPSGHGVLLEKITLSDDGKSYQSTLNLDLFDKAGKGVEMADTATAEITKIDF